MFADLNNTFSEELAPTEFYLGQNYPNPFKEKTLIKYCIAYRTKVTLKIYDTDGKEIEKLVDEYQNPGTYEMIFQSTVGSRQLARGNYFYRLEAGNYKCEKGMELQK